MNTMNSYSLAHLVTLLFVIVVIVGVIWIVARDVMLRKRRRETRNPGAPGDRTVG